MTFPSGQNRLRPRVVTALAVVFLANTFLATSALAQQAAVARDAEPAAAGKTKSGSASSANAAAAGSSANVPTATPTSGDPNATTPSGNANATTPSGNAPAATAAQKAQLRQPTKEETEALLEGMKKYVDDSHDGLVVVEHPDGSMSLDHQGRFQSVTMAKINADGTVSTECLSNVEQARRFLTTEVSQPGAATSSGPAAKNTTPAASSERKKPGSKRAPQPALEVR